METIRSKFYVLRHPSFGYLGGNKIRSRFQSDIKDARKFYQKNHAASCKKQRFISPSWEIREVQYLGFEVKV